MAVQRFHLENGEQSLIIPPGVAHGFLCVSERAIMNYLLDAPYDPQSDTGINPSILADELPCDAIISDRDRALPLFLELSF